MAKIKRMKKGNIRKGYMTYTIVVVDDSGITIAASEIRQEPDEVFNDFHKAVNQELERLQKKYPKMRVVKREVPNVTEFRRWYPKVFLPRRKKSIGGGKDANL